MHLVCTRERAIDQHTWLTRICHHVRAQHLDPLPVTTGLEAVLTLERTLPRLAIIVHPALGAAPDEILDFLDDEHPAVETALFASHADGTLVTRVGRWARDFGDLAEILACVAQHLERGWR